MAVRITKQEVLEYCEDAYVRYIEAPGLSTDTKPVTGIATGSLFLEVDTGDVYAFDEEGNTGEEWGKIAALGGSGS